MGEHLQVAKWSDLPVVTQKRQGPRKLGILVFGQSNATSQEEAGFQLDRQGLDAFEAGVFEMSQGIARTSFTVAPYGELMPCRNPVQFDSFGVNMAQSLGKRLRKLTGADIALVGRGLGGSSFSQNEWNPGDPLATDTITLWTDFQRLHPEYELGAIVMSLGSTDAIVGMSGEEYRSRVIQLITAIRSVPRSAGAALVVCSPPGSLIDANPGGNPFVDPPIPVVLGNGNFPEIVLAQQEIATYVMNSAFCDLRDLPTHDQSHFFAASYRVAGQRAADTAAELLQLRAEAPMPPVRLMFNGERVEDETTKAAAYGGSYQDDVTFGTVLRSNAAAAVTTSVEINPKRYTKSLWVNFLGGTPGNPVNVERHLMGGKSSAQTAGNALTTKRVSHVLAESANVDFGVADGLIFGQWGHVFVTYDGAVINAWANDVKVATDLVISAPETPLPQIIELGTFAGEEPLWADALFYDVRTLPYAATNVERVRIKAEGEAAMFSGNAIGPESFMSSLDVNRRARLLGANSDWRAGMNASGIYYMFYSSSQFATLNLPWNAAAYTNVSQWLYYFDIQIADIAGQARQAFIRAFTYGVPFGGSGRYIPREFHAALLRDSADDPWDLAPGGWRSPVVIPGDSGVNLFELTVLEGTGDIDVTVL